MKCKEIQEILLTDYRDGELREKERRKVEEHLSACRPCREYRELVESAVPAPFRDPKEFTPPQNVWLSIQKKVGEKEKTAPARDITQRLREFLDNLLAAHKPLLATATALSLMAAVLTVSRVSITRPLQNDRQAAVSNYLRQQADFFTSLYANDKKTNGQEKEEGYLDLGTDIEDYFL